MVRTPKTLYEPLTLLRVVHCKGRVSCCNIVMMTDSGLTYLQTYRPPNSEVCGPSQHEA